MHTPACQLTHLSVSILSNSGGSKLGKTLFPATTPGYYWAGSSKIPTMNYLQSWCPTEKIPMPGHWKEVEEFHKTLSAGWKTSVVAKSIDTGVRKTQAWVLDLPPISSLFASVLCKRAVKMTSTWVMRILWGNAILLGQRGTCYFCIWKHKCSGPQV